MSVVITLPWPPSLNNLFANKPGGGRIATPRYRSWQLEAGLVLKAQRPARILGPFNAVMTYRRPDRRIRDLDGLAKAPLDLLVKCGVVQDDHLAQEITLRWSALSPSDKGCMTIELEAAQ